ELGVARGHPALAALTAFVAVAQGSGGRVVDVLERIAASSDARLMRAYAHHARAVAGGDARGLDDVARQYLAFAHPLGAALAFAAAAREWERSGHAERARASMRNLTLLGSVEGTASSG